MGLAPKTLLGPYEIIAPLGAGGMGEVYRARDTRIGRDVAVKVISASFASDPDRLRRFEQEAQAAGSLNHPNILTIHDVGTYDGAPYLVTELLEGEPLRAKIREGGLAVSKAIEWAVQIARGLSAAHEKGIVHRDLKPENIFVTRDGRVKILDFGLAKLTQREAPGTTEGATISVAATESGTVVGTVGYMSPEQVLGKPVDPRSDLFAFGAIMYEMCSGRRAFRRDNTVETLNAILKDEPPFPHSLIPVALERIIRHCLEKQAGDRFQTAKDLSFALEAVTTLSAASVQSQPPKRLLLLWAVAAVMAVAGVAAGWWIRPMFHRDSAPSLSRALRVTNTPAQEFGPAISPDGKWVAYFSNARGPSDVWVKFLDNGSTLNLTASLTLDVQVRAGIGGLDISPDGNKISFGARPDPSSSSSDTWVIPAPLGGVPRKLLQTLQGMRWSPDGRQLACVRTGSTRGDALIVADSDGSNQRELVSQRGGRHIHWLAWSSDGKHIYFIYTFDTWHTEPSEIYRVPFGGGEIEPVVQSSRRAIYPVPVPDGAGLIYAGNPNSVDLGLWWQPLRGGEPRPLTTGVGEHTEARLSAGGRRLVCTLIEKRQSLLSVPVRFGLALQMSQITDGYSGDLDPALSARGDRIAFSSSRSGSRNLWISRLDGSLASPLTSENAIDERPAFSPDGQQIAFVSDRGGRRGIWLMSADGGAARFVGEAVVLDTLTWSPDGKRILYATPGGDLPQLAAISPSDGKVERIPTPGGAFSPAWSPTEDCIAYLAPATTGPSNPQIAFMNSHGQALYSTLPKMGSYGNGFLCWSPDGRRLAAVSNLANTSSYISIVEPRGPEPFRKLADFPITVRIRGITWTPDGSAVIIGKQESLGDIVLFDVTR